MPVPKGKRYGGRQKGTKNRTTLEREAATAAVVAEAKANGIQPLEVLLGSMRKSWAQGDCKQASLYAEKAAPYVHARLSSTDLKVSDDRTINELNINELDALIQQRFPDEIREIRANGANGPARDVH